MAIRNLNLKGAVLAAPLAGVSSRPFRVLAIRAGAAITYTEMVSADGIARHQAKTLTLMEFGPEEQPLGVQIFGADPEIMRQAAEIVAQRLNPDLIDINLGCPVKKVVRKNGGAAVLKDLVLTEEIIRATVEGAGLVPVTIKIRTGWDDSSPVYLEAGRIAERCGAKAVTLHARSRAKGYSGLADWSAIKNLAEAINIPVIGNGDINTPLDARRMIDETGCDAVMIGRAALGNPGIFRQVSHYLKTGEFLDEPSPKDKIDTARLHARLMAQQFGEERGVVKTRRWLGWYVKGFVGASVLRPMLFKVTSLKEIDQLFDDYLLNRLKLGPDT